MVRRGRRRVAAVGKGIAAAVAARGAAAGRGITCGRCAAGRATRATRAVGPVEACRIYGTLTWMSLMITSLDGSIEVAREDHTGKTKDREPKGGERRGGGLILER